MGGQGGDGAFDAHSGKLNADLRNLPFDDGFADRAVAIHVLEHFYFWEVPAVLAEWKRVLKPGGRLALELPCMDKVFGYISESLQKNSPPHPTFSWLALWGDPRHRDPAMCHRWGYFKTDLQNLLTEAGFIDIRDEEPKYHFPIRDMRFTAIKPLTP